MGDSSHLEADVTLHEYPRNVHKDARSFETVTKRIFKGEFRGTSLKQDIVSIGSSDLTWRLQKH